VPTAACPLQRQVDSPNLARPVELAEPARDERAGIVLPKERCLPESLGREGRIE
jgi:hypothetical protein